jgi:ribosomal protein L32
MYSIFGMSRAADIVSDFNAEADAARAESKATSLEFRVHVLEAYLTKAMIINETLWEIMKEKLNLTDDILRDQLSKVDLRESTSKECPKCHHMVAPHHPICIYCGQVIDNSIFT